MSSGDGRKSTTASSSAWTPLFLKAAPASTGTTLPEMVALRSTVRISSSDSSCSSRYLCRMASSCSTIASSRWWRISLTLSFNAAGTGPSTYFLPSESSSYTISTWRIRSMMPVNSSPEPSGRWIGTTLAPSRSRTILTHISKSAPTRSILFTMCVKMVHLVHEDNARHVVAFRLAPHGFGLRLDAAHRVEHGDGAVQHPQRTLHLDGEVHVSGSIDDVDAVRLAAAGPEGGGGGRSDGDAALLLLLHPVHGGGAVVHLAQLVRPAGVVQDALGRSRFPGIDVGHDADVANLVERRSARHSSLS